MSQKSVRFALHAMERCGEREISESRVCEIIALPYMCSPAKNQHKKYCGANGEVVIAKEYKDLWVVKTVYWIGGENGRRNG